MAPADGSFSRWRSCRDVDGTADPSSVAGYLDDLAALRAVAAEKRQALGLLALDRGGRCLDVGCGSGPELGWLAELVGPDGSVVGLDRSRRLLDAAAGRHHDATISLVHGDAGALPFEDGAFDAVRADRTLQHLTDPGRALTELIRVARPGGRVVISEFRWGLVGPDLDRGVTDAVMQAMAPERDRREWIGHSLAALATATGLRDVEAISRDHDLEDAGEISRLLNLSWSLPAAVERGLVTAPRARAWERSLHAQAGRGEVFAVVVFLHVAGTA